MIKKIILFIIFIVIAYFFISKVNECTNRVRNTYNKYLKDSSLLHQLNFDVILLRIHLIDAIYFDDMCISNGRRYTYTKAKLNKKIKRGYDIFSYVMKELDDTTFRTSNIFFD